MFSDISTSTIAIFLICLFGATAVHETMHALVAYKLGDDLAYLHGRISLNPLRHIDPILTVVLPLVLLLFGMTPILAAKPVPINTPRVRGGDDGLALIGLAGPLSNFLMAALTGFVLKNVSIEQETVYNFLIIFFQVNVGLFIFNMLPIPPLDGSRLLYAFAPPKVQEVMERIESFGVLGVVLILAVIYPIISPFLTSAYNFVVVLLL